MRKLTPLILLITLLWSCSQSPKANNEISQTTKPAALSKEKVIFYAADSIPIAAHLYHHRDDAPVIVLCHQARFNKMEYAGTAEKLNQMGFNCLAIDQRSGGPIADYINETNLRAVEAGKAVDFLDAEPDIMAAIAYAQKKYNGPLLLWGSSYSSTLALYIAAENKNVSAVISFSPGNYMAEQRGDLVEILKDYDRPMFLTSSKREAPYVSELIKKRELDKLQVQFIPEGPGHHGSRALWPHQAGGEEYWTAIKNFLEEYRSTLQ